MCVSNDRYRYTFLYKYFAVQMVMYKYVVNSNSRRCYTWSSLYEICKLLFVPAQLVPGRKTCGFVYTICSVWDLPQQSIRPNILLCFYRAASMQNGLGMSVNVCLSVCQTRELWKKRKKLLPTFYTYERPIILAFWQKEWLVGNDPLYLKLTPCLLKRKFSIDFC